MLIFTHYRSPIGKLLLTSDGAALTGLWMEGQMAAPEGTPDASHPVLLAAGQWLDAYFSGKPEVPAFALNPQGTAFQQRVWQILLTIPFGQTRTYGDIARQIASEMGNEKMSSQAVGQAVGRNPISIVIPCHRVIGAGGRLTGYAGGLDKKQWLLNHEGVSLSGGNKCDM